MRFEFTYRIENVREAVRTATSTARRPVRVVRGVFAWLMFVIAAAFMFLFLQASRSAPAAAQELPEIDLMLVLIPAALPGVVLVVVLSWSIYKQVRTRPSSSRDPGVRASGPPPSKLGEKVVGYFLVGLLLFAIFWLTAPGPQILVRASRPTMVWVAMSVLLSEVFLLVAYGQLYTRLAVRSQWNAKPTWRRDKVMLLEGAGLTVIDCLSRNEYRWEYFSKARETANLFVFHGEDNLMYLLPKRAIGEAELDQVRAIILNGIPESQFLVTPGGFAVVPKLPVPVQAISG